MDGLQASGAATPADRGSAPGHLPAAVSQLVLGALPAAGGLPAGGLLRRLDRLGVAGDLQQLLLGRHLGQDGLVLVHGLAQRRRRPLPGRSARLCVDLGRGRAIVRLSRCVALRGRWRASVVVLIESLRDRTLERRVGRRRRRVLLRSGSLGHAGRGRAADATDDRSHQRLGLVLRRVQEVGPLPPARHDILHDALVSLLGALGHGLQGEAAEAGGWVKIPNVGRHQDRHIQRKNGRRLGHRLVGRHPLVHLLLHQVGHLGRGLQRGHGRVSDDALSDLAYLEGTASDRPRFRRPRRRLESTLCRPPGGEAGQQERGHRPQAAHDVVVQVRVFDRQVLVQVLLEVVPGPCQSLAEQLLGRSSDRSHPVGRGASGAGHDGRHQRRQAQRELLRTAGEVAARPVRLRFFHQLLRARRHRHPGLVQREVGVHGRLGHGDPLLAFGQRLHPGDGRRVRHAHRCGRGRGGDLLGALRLGQRLHAGDDVGIGDERHATRSPRCRAGSPPRTTPRRRSA